MKEELAVASKLLLLILGKRKRLRVTGYSMIPLLEPGEEILFDPKAYRNSLPQTGDIVVAQHPYQEKQIVKRVTLVLEDGSCFLEGDNSNASTDSRSYGFVPSSKIIGRVTCKFP